MLSFISAKEAAEKWNISQRRVAILCNENRVDGAMMVGNMWIIPCSAEKPADNRMVKCENTKTETIKPFAKWVGGKSHLTKKIKKYISEDCRTFTKYVEPMVGGGALFCDLISNSNFNQIYISDTNTELINCYNVIKDNVKPLTERLSEMQLNFLPMDQNGRKYYYYKARDKFNSLSLSGETSVEKAALFIFLNKTCFNGLFRVNKKGQFNVPMGQYKNPMICDEKNLINISAALKNVNIVCGDYTLSEDFIDENTFVYIDPPYRPISQTSAFTSYTADSFGDAEQIRLSEYIERIDKKGAKFVLSNSDPKNTNPDDNFFEDLYSNYIIERVAAMRSINSKGDNRGKISELLIHN